MGYDAPKISGAKMQHPNSQSFEWWCIEIDMHVQVVGCLEIAYV